MKNLKSIILPTLLVLITLFAAFNLDFIVLKLKERKISNERKHTLHKLKRSCERNDFNVTYPKADTLSACRMLVEILKTKDISYQLKAARKLCDLDDKVYCLFLYRNSKLDKGQASELLRKACNARRGGVMEACDILERQIP